MEPPAWRGFLLPKLQERFSPLVASIFVWLPWAAWHAPLDFSGGIGSNWALWVQVRLIYFIPITILVVAKNSIGHKSGLFMRASQDGKTC